MFRQIRTAAQEAHDTLFADAVGAATLMVALVVGLWLPGL